MDVPSCSNKTTFLKKIFDFMFVSSQSQRYEISLRKMSMTDTT